MHVYVVVFVGCVSGNVYVFIYMCVYVCLYVCMYACMYVCMHVCVYAICVYHCGHGSHMQFTHYFWSFQVQEESFDEAGTASPPLLPTPTFANTSTSALMHR